MSPYPPSAAVFRAEFNIEVPVGTRFSCEDLNFVVTARMDTSEDTATGLSHRVTCETAGAQANGYTGQLIPIEYVDGLTHAELVYQAVTAASGMSVDGAMSPFQTGCTLTAEMPGMAFTFSM